MPEFLKVKGKIVNVRYSKAEQKAMEEEIRRQQAEYIRKTENEIDAMMLWAVHKLCGRGHKRLKEFYFDFEPMLQELLQRFECSATESEWAYTEALKEYGIDIEELRKEAERRRKEG